MDNGVFKIFSVKSPLGHYYVQEMPGYCRVGRDFAIMKDRRQYVWRRYSDPEKAIVDLLRDLLRQYEAPKLDLK